MTAALLEVNKLGGLFLEIRSPFPWRFGTFWDLSWPLSVAVESESVLLGGPQAVVRKP